MLAHSLEFVESRQHRTSAGNSVDDRLTLANQVLHSLGPNSLSIGHRAAISFRALPRMHFLNHSRNSTSRICDHSEESLSEFGNVRIIRRGHIEIRPSTSD